MPNIWNNMIYATVNGGIRKQKDIDSEEEFNHYISWVIVLDNFVDCRNAIWISEPYNWQVSNNLSITFNHSIIRLSFCTCFTTWKKNN